MFVIQINLRKLINVLNFYNILHIGIYHNNPCRKPDWWEHNVRADLYGTKPNKQQQI